MFNVRGIIRVMHLGKLAAIVLATAVVSGGAASYITSKNTVKAVGHQWVEINSEVLLGHIKSWEYVGQLLGEGCVDEAAETIEIEVSWRLDSLKERMDKYEHVKEHLIRKDPNIIQRVKEHKGRNVGTLPACKEPLTMRPSRRSKLRGWA